MLFKTASSLVNRGVTRLMLEEPDGDWLFRLNVRNLDVCSIFDCVLGQSYGTYREGLTRLWPQFGCIRELEDFPDELFDLAAGHGFAVWKWVHPVTLNKAWQERIVAERIAILKAAA